MSIIKYGNEEDWLSLYNTTLKANYSEKMSILFSLIHTNNIKLLK
jgi:hypothetical protein